MYEAAQNQDWATVRKMQQRINTLHGIISACGGRVIPAIKAGVVVEGRCDPWMRSRYMGPTADDVKTVQEVLTSLND
jgi:dihydrodipicolinate synthase/N-acetylneuraminate lyase